MRKRTHLTLALLFIALSLLLTLFLFSSSLSSSRFASGQKLIKHFTGGQVINRSRQPVVVFDWRLPTVLSPSSKSRDQAVGDVDALLIDGPTLINGRYYDKGVWKFCDLATVTVQDVAIEGGPDQSSRPGKSYASNWAGWLCQLGGDMGVFPSIETATPIYR